MSVSSFSHAKCSGVMPAHGYVHILTHTHTHTHMYTYIV